MLLSDEPETQNPAEGFYWLECAVQNGSDYAAYRLGKEYLSGKITPKNPERAAEYARMAAGHKADDHEQGQTNSTMSMGW